jgi:hypothetical protein
VFDLFDELGCQKLGNFFAYGTTPSFGKPAKWLVNWLRPFVDVQAVLGKFLWDTWHVRRLPCEDVTILTKKLDERAFLFVGEVGTNACRLELSPCSKVIHLVSCADSNCTAGSHAGHLVGIMSFMSTSLQISANSFLLIASCAIVEPRVCTQQLSSDCSRQL